MWNHFHLDSIVFQGKKKDGVEKEGAEKAQAGRNTLERLSVARFSRFSPSKIIGQSHHTKLSSSTPQKIFHSMLKTLTGKMEKSN